MELTTTLCPSEETKKLQKGGKWLLCILI
jgi:hypothetical protein